MIFNVSILRVGYRSPFGRKGYEYQVEGGLGDGMYEQSALFSTDKAGLFNARNHGNIMAAQAQLVAAMREVERVELDLFHRFAESFESDSNANHQVELEAFRIRLIGGSIRCILEPPLKVE